MDRLQYYHSKHYNKSMGLCVPIKWTLNILISDCLILESRSPRLYRIARRTVFSKTLLIVDNPELIGVIEFGRDDPDQMKL